MRPPVSQTARTMTWLGLAFLFVGLFIKITWELHEDNELGILDRQILIFISNLRISVLNGSAVDITALGSPSVLTLFTLIGVLLLGLNRDRQGSAYLAVGSIGSAIGTYVLKQIFTRPRPNVIPHLVEVSGFSYPSGHSLAATSFYLLLMFLAWRYYQAWNARIALLICTGFLICGVCFSRLYLGVHYPSDVLSGMFLGSAWVCFLTAFFKLPWSHVARYQARK